MDKPSDTPRTDEGYRAHYAEHEHNRELCRSLERENTRLWEALIKRIALPDKTVGFECVVCHAANRVREQIGHAPNCALRTARPAAGGEE